MGFSAAIYAYPKYKELTLDQIETVLQVISYQENQWAKDNYATVEDYLKQIYPKYADLLGTISTDAIDFYKRNKKKDEDGIECYGPTFAYWCSNGSGDIYDKFISLQDSDTDSDTQVILTKEKIYDLMDFFWQNITEYLPQPASIKYAFNYLYKDNEEDEECPDIKLTKCDGVEITFDDGKIVRANTGSEEYCGLGIAKNVYYDDWTYSGYLIGMENCLKILKEIDFDKYYVVYSGGY